MPNNKGHDAMDKVLNATTTIPVGVSAMTFCGITVSDWIVILTLTLLVLQLMVWGTRAIKALHATIRQLWSKDGEV